MRLYRRRYPGAGLLLAAALLAGSTALGQSEAPPTFGDDYGPGDYGRIRYEENGLTIVRAETEAMRDFPAAGQVNAPIFPGDAVTTNGEQRAEVQLAAGSLVRIDHDSQVTFLALSDPYVEVPDNSIVQLARGAMRLEAVVDEREEFRVDTPACAIYLGGDADIRVEVRGDRTLVASRRGVAEVDTVGGSLVVRAGMATEITAGLAPQDSRPFNTFLVDDFDRWVADRVAAFAVESDSTVAVAEVYDELPAEVRPYYGELSRHGDWVRNDTYGQVWVPRAISAEWRPYHHGHWGYGERGYFWVSREPWGWAPYHFGRWTWIPGFGWSWVPGRVFGGAWVSWSWGSKHVGWCALDYWNRPAHRGAPTRGVYDTHTWTFVSYEHLSRVDPAAHHVALNGVSDLDDTVIVTAAPRVAPRRLTRVETRVKVIADARADTRSQIPVTGGDERDARSRPFVELERQADLKRTASQAKEQLPVLPPIRATPVSRSTNQRREASGGKTSLSPSLKKTLVHSEQEELEGASKRWKSIYREMSQPRPTRSQSVPETEKGTEDDEPGRKPPARQSRGSRPPDGKPSGDDRYATGLASPPTRRPRPVTDRTPTRTYRPSPKTRATPQRKTVAAPRSTSSPTRRTSPKRSVTAPRPRPVVSAPVRPATPRRTVAPAPTRPRPPARSAPTKSKNRRGGGNSNG